MSKIIKHIFDIYINDDVLVNKKYLWDNFFNIVPSYLKLDLYKLMLKHKVGSINYVSNNIDIIKLYINHYIKSRKLNIISSDIIINLAKKQLENNISNIYYDELLNDKINHILKIYSQKNNLDNLDFIETIIEKKDNKLITGVHNHKIFGDKLLDINFIETIIEKKDNKLISGVHNHKTFGDKLLDINFIFRIAKKKHYLLWYVLSKKTNISLSLFRYYLENVYSVQKLYDHYPCEHDDLCKFNKDSLPDEEKLTQQKNIIINNFLENKTIINILLLQSRHDNLLWTIIKSNQHVNWSYNILSKHPCITWQVIIENPELPWSYENLCQNINMTLDNINLFIKFNNIELTKNNQPRELFAQNINLTSSEIDSFLDKEKNQIYKKYYFLRDDPLALNPNITYDIVKKYGSPNIAEQYDTLIQNKFIESDIFNMEYYKIIQTQKQLNMINKELMTKYRV